MLAGRGNTRAFGMHGVRLAPLGWIHGKHSHGPPSAPRLAQSGTLHTHEKEQRGRARLAGITGTEAAAVNGAGCRGLCMRSWQDAALMNARLRHK